MIIVNTSGNGATTWAPLKHAEWNGFTPTDLVFPSFLFAVGNAMSFVMKKWNTFSQAHVLYKIFKRTAIIFLLGYLMYWFPFFRLDGSRHIISFPIAETRIMGVLQRIALCYGFAALMIYYLKPKRAIIISAALLLVYWFLAIGFGDLTIQGNTCLKLDKWLMGENHLYHGEGIPFDPEGWLSTIPAIFNVVAGFVVGKLVQEKGKTFEGLSKILLAGFILITVAFFWNYVFPINKKLWTSSFSLLTVGLDCVILSGIIYYTEFLNKRFGTWFFEIPGKNPLIVYLLSELLIVVLWMLPPIGTVQIPIWIYENIFSYVGAHFGAFLFAVAYMLLCWLVGCFMDKNKIYIRV
jgi:Uncharacterized conserved protein